jgi:eukaryotic-like serine/threonine-protein kinase
MSPAGSRSLRELFLEAAEIENLAAQAAFVQTACGEDTVLRHRLENLLAAERSVGPVPVQPAPPAVSEGPGTLIGKYKLLEKLGEGGCGVVYMAEQEEPVKRKVALKVIKLGMDTRQVVARFEAERQALALMEHPNIAKVLDAGATETGRPYFVMELVGGVKITDYCEQNHLNTKQRLELFIQVCRAVQHAHQKGVIHRDLKPSNVLVATQDGVAVPKVIDFGIAKATQGKLTDQTVFTAFEQFLGTPAYMSPEQAQLGGLDVDTRSDIYSLGVLLYELLTGKTPFDTKELLAAGLDAMRKTILEKEPPTPSTRLSQERQGARSEGGGKSEARSPRSEIDKDLDWVVMKCLEKDRGRRYETANGLAVDLQRHLNDEPVVASPPSRLYRFQKMVRRNKVLIAAAGAVVLALVIGLGLSSWLFFRERTARREQMRLSQQAQTEKERAQAQAAARQQEAELLQDIIMGVAPSIAKGRDTSLLREILDKTADRVANELTNQPGLAGEMCHYLASAYREVGLYQQMADISERELKFARAGFGPGDPARVPALSDLGSAYRLVGNYEQAEATHREALTILRGAAGTDAATVARSLNALALVLRDQEKLAEAEETYGEALKLLRGRFGENHVEVATVLNNLGTVLRGEGKLAKAEALQREALDVRRKLFGEEHPDVANSLNNLAVLLREEGQLGEAESLFREALAIRRKLPGAQHPSTANTLFRLAEVLSDKGNSAEAEACYREALAIQHGALGVEHPLTTATFQNLLSLLGDARKFDEAEQLCRDELSALRARLPADDPRLADALAQFAHILITEGKFAEVEPLARECLAIREKKNPEDWRTFNTRSLVGDSLLGQQKYADAEPLLLSGYEGMKQRSAKMPPEGRVNLQEALKRLVRLYDASGQNAQTTKWRLELEELHRVQTNSTDTTSKSKR